MVRRFAALVAFSAGLASAGAAQAQWVDGRGGSCRAACAATGSTAISSGTYKNGQPYYICAADAFGEGRRPGYNLEPSWSNACIVGFGGKEERVGAYACLCEGNRAQAPAPAGAVAAAGGGLTTASFRNIEYSDLQKWNSSGCSFAVYRGKDNIGLFDTQDPKKTAAFKIDGKLLFAGASARKDPQSYWNGTVSGHEIKMIKGKVNPKFKNDGGSTGGEGRLDWSGPNGQGSIPIRWEEGC